MHRSTSGLDRSVCLSGDGGLEVTPEATAQDPPNASTSTSKQRIHKVWHFNCHTPVCFPAARHRSTFIVPYLQITRLCLRRFARVYIVISSKKGSINQASTLSRAIIAWHCLTVHSRHTGTLLKFLILPSAHHSTISSSPARLDR
jgi:hypothetical protein